ncbi:hypothetical protein NUU61_005951 [Penicillium alfredii]|uniref:Uncharacterized protein n=1 Tax=Penicillium alfredii TaxID=1506179 RepID=A0A9W9K3A7_9EURO|nr:uncharacterized protein NUU61_005951 [Penicillium alfredii]KAJ5091081.1 hypothetical protein NUU61_005951 [Penicillium alfredii]
MYGQVRDHPQRDDQISLGLKPMAFPIRQVSTEVPDDAQENSMLVEIAHFPSYLKDRRGSFLGAMIDTACWVKSSRATVFSLTPGL